MVGGMLTNWAMIELGEARCRPLVTFLLNQEEEEKMLIATQIKTAPPITHQSQPPYPPCNLQIRVSSELHLFSRRKLKRINLSKADQVGRGGWCTPPPACSRSREKERGHAMLAQHCLHGFEGLIARLRRAI